MLPRTYVRYSTDQVLYLKQHYQLLPNADLARALGIDSPQKVRELARRHGIKWRAENGAPHWRASKTPNHQAPRWAA